MPKTSELINKNSVSLPEEYLYTSLVLHIGKPISFAMKADGKIFYSVLDLNSTSGSSSEIDKDHWSGVDNESPSKSQLYFPREITQTGYAITPTVEVGYYDNSGKQLVKEIKDGVPIGFDDKEISIAELKSKYDHHYSSTARLGAIKPFQALSDGKYLYIFRQSIGKSNSTNTSEPSELFIDNNLLVDRFVLSGTFLKPAREIRYQRSRQKQTPESEFDTLSAVDVEGNPFYQPTKKLGFVANLTPAPSAQANNGTATCHQDFSVLLIPAEGSEEQRWIIFSADSKTQKINIFNIRYDASLIFDTSDSEASVNAFIEKYQLGDSFTGDIQKQVQDRYLSLNWNEDADTAIAEQLKNLFIQNREGVVTNLIADEEVTLDEISEIVYAYRTGVRKDDFTLGYTAEWPLTSSVSGDYIDGDKNKGLKPEYRFQGPEGGLGWLNSRTKPLIPVNGLSACYFYQQEIGADNKPMKTSASIMLAAGVEDGQENRFIAVLQFTVSGSGRLSRITSDTINLSAVNMQALDENPYASLDEIPTSDDNKPYWQPPQSMNVVDIDSNGLSTNGGLLQFSYTSADQAANEGFSDAAEATAPQLFDDSLGRVNLYFKGRTDNFFVVYFNPNSGKSTHKTPDGSAALELIPRLPLNLDLTVAVTVNNTADLRISSQGNAENDIETWAALPTKAPQIAYILNGSSPDATLDASHCMYMGTLDPLGDTEDPKAAYLESGNCSGVIKIRSSRSNNLLFNTEVTTGKNLPLSQVSDYLGKNRGIKLAGKNFVIEEDSTDIYADLFYKSYLNNLVAKESDISNIWEGLADSNVLLINTGVSAGNTQNEDDTAYINDAEFLKNEFEENIRGILESRNLEYISSAALNDQENRLNALAHTLIQLIKDIRDVLIVQFKVRSESDKVSRIGAGSKVISAYNYDDNFSCMPTEINGPGVKTWEHARSYLFNATYDISVTDSDDGIKTDSYSYNITNTIGQWEDWEASLALKFSPSGSNGSIFSTTDESDISALAPTRKGLSAEAWFKAASSETQSILLHKDDNQHYAIGLKKKEGNQFQYFCEFAGKTYLTNQVYDLAGQSAAALDGAAWHHLAFTHKKYWGYELIDGTELNCGNDSSLNLTDEFTIEVCVNPNRSGSILRKEEEFKLWIDENNILQFLQTSPFNKEPYKRYNASLKKFVEYQKTYSCDVSSLIGQCYKITVIRSRKKVQTQAAKEEYPLTGSDSSTNSSSEGKWYDGLEGDEITKGLAEKQDQQENTFDITTSDLFGSNQSTSSADTQYFYTIVISQDNSEISSRSRQEYSWEIGKVSKLNAHGDFIIGGDGFQGTFGFIRIWDCALSKDEAIAFSKRASDTGLIANWRLTEGSGRFLYENVSGNHAVRDENHTNANARWVTSPRTDISDTLSFYVDGVAVDAPVQNENEEKITASDNIPNQFSLAGINKGASQLTKPANGQLEEVRIWDRARSPEQISDNMYGRLTGNFDQLLANYAFDTKMEGTSLPDSSRNSIELTANNSGYFDQVLSTAPVSTEIPAVRSALTGVITGYEDTLNSSPGIVEYGDFQKDDNGLIKGVLKRCYSYIDQDGNWHRVTGYKVGDLVSQWYSQVQFDPQVIGFIEGAPPVPGENNIPLPLRAFRLSSSVGLSESEDVFYNYSVSKEAGWQAAIESEVENGAKITSIIAPFGIGLGVEIKVKAAFKSKWSLSGNRSETMSRGSGVNRNRTFNTTLVPYKNTSTSSDNVSYHPGNIGSALVKSKTADVYLLRLAHNNALYGINWVPNPDIPEDVNIINFPINPNYVKQGTLDGKLGDSTDIHYPQAQSAYGEYSYFKPKEAYKLKKTIEREKLELQAYFEDSFSVSGISGNFAAAAATTGVLNAAGMIPGYGAYSAVANMTTGHLAAQLGYDNTELASAMKDIPVQKNLVNTYVWTMEGGYLADTSEVASCQQEVYSGKISLQLDGSAGYKAEASGGGAFKAAAMLGSGASLTLTHSRAKESNRSFSINAKMDIPTMSRYGYGGSDGLSLLDNHIEPGTVDAYRFMTFYLEPKAEHFNELFTTVIDPIWLDESGDPNAIALRQAMGNVDKAKPCWRIMHRVTYVSRILPKFTAEAPPSLEKTMAISGIESNYGLIKRFEPFVSGLTDITSFNKKIDDIITRQMPEFSPHKQAIKGYLALYFGLSQS